MSMTRAECAALRKVITQLVEGPLWFDHEPSTSQLRAWHYELRKLTHSRNMRLVNELQALLPADQRITAEGMQALGLAQSWRRHATEFAAPAAPTQAQDQADGRALHQEWYRAQEEAPQYTAPEPEPAPLAPEPLRIPVPVQQCKAEAVGLHCEYPNCDCSP